MTGALCLLATALLVSPTNAPASFTCETEQTFVVPDITEREVWLDCDLAFTATASNRVEFAFGHDADNDGQLDDSESPFVFAIDCGRIVVRDGHGYILASQAVPNGIVRLSLLPARQERNDSWRIATTDGTQILAGTFPGEITSPRTWNRVRIRLNGTDSTTAHVQLKKNRHTLVFFIR